MSTMDKSKAVLNSRFALIEAVVLLFGQFRRIHLRRGFDLAPATATRILTDYCKQHPGELVYDGASKSYKAGELFCASELAKFGVEAQRFYEAACLLAGGQIVQTETIIN